MDEASTKISKTTSVFPSAGRYDAGGPAASIAVKTWTPDGVTPDNPPRSILQINHGMCEYVDRYDAFARAAAGRGLLVVGMDFIGHGDSVTDASQLGFTGPALPGGGNVFVDDMHTLRQRTQAAWPGVPYVMLGHSMGSFVLRAYLAQHGDGLAGAVISGTALMAAPMVGVAKALLGVLGVFHKPEYRSPFFEGMSVGPYNKPFTPKGGVARTPFEWLSRDTAQVDKYAADPRCGFVFSLAADRLMIDVLARANAASAYQSTPKSLPLLLVSGTADPVGGMSKGVTTVAEAYRRAGVGDVTLKLYEDGRHEMLNELNRDEATEDILNWVDGQIV